MRWALCVALSILGAPSFAHGQSAPKDKHKLELFTRYFSITTVIPRAYIPAATCSSLISQADDIVSHEALKTVDEIDLQVASENLRACATLTLTRFERDLAVGLYGAVVSEQERRERGEK